jgi:hypothetical protein
MAVKICGRQSGHEKDEGKMAVIWHGKVYLWYLAVELNFVASGQIFWLIWPKSFIRSWQH